MGKLPFFYRRKIEASPQVSYWSNNIPDRVNLRVSSTKTLRARYNSVSMFKEKSRTSWVLAKPRQSLQFMSQNTLLYRFIELLPIHIVICKSPSSLYKYFKDRIINQKQIIKQTEIVVELDTIDGLERSDDPQQENSNSAIMTDRSLAIIVKSSKK
ncbi:unnamed protein product [Rhizophagus irregularis]|nr:unnamed protein product [Rhizophagus irregularis]